MELPAGLERQVKQRSAIAVDGAPLSYVVTLAAVVGALAFIPLSIIIGAGKSFPMSQGIYPLVGILLGPVAGALADGIGALVGVLLFPHTSFLPFATITGAVTGGLAAGAAGDGKRRWIAWVIAVVGWLAYGTYVMWAVLHNGVNLSIILTATIINSSALLLYTLPTRLLAVRFIKHADLKRVATGLFLMSWMCAGLTHLMAGMIVYFRIGWPSEVFLGMAPVAPLENVIRALVGAVVGTGVIAGLRATGLIKPEHAAY